MAKKKSMKIDANVKAIVDELNLWPGIYTMSSCGGHVKITNVSQYPEGDFFVCFHVEVLEGGWRSLQAIAFAVDRCDDFKKLVILVWCAGDDPETMAFQLKGVDHASPDSLAKCLREFREPSLKKN